MPDEFQKKFGQIEPEPLLSTGSIYGVRAWSIDKLPSYLSTLVRDSLSSATRAMLPEITESYSLVGHYGYHWVRGENVARCAKSMLFPPGSRRSQFTQEIYTGCNPPAGLDCTCGFYAYWDADAILDSVSVFWTPRRVLGVIEAYGRTVQGEFGFRAEKAKILALYTVPYSGRAPNASEVAGAYGVPLFNDPELMFAEFPPSDPPEIDTKE